MTKQEFITEGSKFTIRKSTTLYWLERRQIKENEVYLIICYKDAGNWLHTSDIKINKSSITVACRFGTIVTYTSIPMTDIKLI